MLSGTVAVDSARATIPELGIELANVQLRLAGEGSRHLRVQGGMSSGDGRVTIDGEASIKDDGTPTATLALKGERFLAANRPDLRLIASPDLTAKLEGDRAEQYGHGHGARGRHQVRAATRSCARASTST